MTTATKEKPKAAAKKVRKPRQTLPRITTDQVVNSHLPLTPEGTELMGKAYVETFLPALGKWKVEAKAAQVAGKDIPEFPKKAIPNLNKGRMTHAQWMKALSDRFEDPDLPLHPLYNVVQNEFIRALNAPFVRKVKAADAPVQPKDWDVKLQGPWHRMDTEGNEVPSHWLIDRGKSRSCHSGRIETIMARNCENPEDNIVTIGSSRYVIGTAAGIEGAAILLMNPQEQGDKGKSNYFNNTDQALRSSLGKSRDAANVVFQILDKGNAADGTLLRLAFDEYGTEFYTFPGWATSPGYLQQDGKNLTQTQIRRLGDKPTGVKFVAIKMSDPLMGERIPWKDLWALISKAEGKKGRDTMNARPTKIEDGPKDKAKTNAARNIIVQCRVKPEEFFPFAFRYASLGFVLSYVSDVEGNKTFRVVVGVRDNWEFVVNQNDAKRLAAEKAEEAEEAEETEVEAPALKVVKATPKPKVKAKPPVGRSLKVAAKAKAKPAAKAKVAPKAKKAKPSKEAVEAKSEPVEPVPAAPVTHDTSESEVEPTPAETDALAKEIED